MDVEVADARWLPLADAPRLLAYKGEREMAEQALREPRRATLYSCPAAVPTFALNFYNPAVADQLRSSRKTATIRLGDKSPKYRKGMIVTVLCGARYGQRERIFDAVIDKVEVKGSATSHRARSSTTTRRSAAPTSSRASSASSTTARSPRTTSSP